MNELITLKLEQSKSSQVSLFMELTARALELEFYPVVTPYVWGTENRAVYHYESGATLVTLERTENITGSTTGYKSTFELIGKNTPVREAQSAIEELAEENGIDIILSLPREEKQ